MSDAAKRAVEASSDASISDEEFYRRFNAVATEMQSKRAADIPEMMDVLSNGVADGYSRRAALLAMLCGAFVEGGIEHPGFTQALLTRLSGILKHARVFGEALVQQRGDREELSEAEIAELRGRLPEEARNWDDFEKFFAPTIATLSTSAANRAQGKCLLSDAQALEGMSSQARWISKILRVFDDEPIVVLEPATLSGLVGRMSGISENFQLNVLLMDVFPKSKSGWFSRRRVSREAAQIARGNGPQMASEILKGTWNLYAWTILRGRDELPGPLDVDASAHWVWNEGIPADIPCFDNQRVVVLGPPAYERSWRSQRDFKCLKADLRVEKILTAAEVDEWIKKLRNA